MIDLKKVAAVLVLFLAGCASFPPPRPHSPGPECVEAKLDMGCWIKNFQWEWVWVCVHQTANGPTPAVYDPRDCPCPPGGKRGPDSPQCVKPLVQHETIKIPYADWRLGFEIGCLMWERGIREPAEDSK